MQLINKNKLSTDIQKGVKRHYINLVQELGQDYAPDFESFSIDVSNYIDVNCPLSEYNSVSTAAAVANAIDIIKDQYANYNDDWFDYLNKIRLEDFIKFSKTDSLEELEEFHAFPEDKRYEISGHLFDVLTGDELAGYFLHRLAIDGDIDFYYLNEFRTIEFIYMIENLIKLVKGLVNITPSYYKQNNSTWLASSRYHYKAAITAVAVMFSLLEEEDANYWATIGGFLDSNNTPRFFNLIRDIVKTGGAYV